MAVEGTGVRPSTSRVEKSVCVVSLLVGPRSWVLGLLLKLDLEPELEEEEVRERGEACRCWRCCRGRGKAERAVDGWRARQDGVGVRIEAAISWMLGRFGRCEVRGLRGGIAGVKCV
jgi:hypothetical protein